MFFVQQKLYFILCTFSVLLRVDFVFVFLFTFSRLAGVEYGILLMYSNPGQLVLTRISTKEDDGLCRVRGVFFMQPAKMKHLNLRSLERQAKREPDRCLSVPLGI